MRAGLDTRCTAQEHGNLQQFAHLCGARVDATGLGVVVRNKLSLRNAVSCNLATLKDCEAAATKIGPNPSSARTLVAMPAPTTAMAMIRTRIGHSCQRAGRAFYRLPDDEATVDVAAPSV